MSRQVARAMRDQVIRVNEDASQQTIDELRAEVARLQNLLQQQQVAPVQQENIPSIGTDGKMMYQGRPVITVEQAAIRAGVSYWIASRYCREGHWKAVHLNPRKVLVFEDQAFTLRPKRERAAKQSQPKQQSRRGKN